MYRSKIPSVVKAASVAAATGTDTKSSKQDKQEAATPPHVKLPTPAHTPHHSRYRHFNSIPPPIGTPIVRCGTQPIGATTAAESEVSQTEVRSSHHQPSANAVPTNQVPTQSTSTSPTMKAALEYAKNLASRPRPSVASVTAQNMALRAIKPIPYKHEDDDINKANNASTSSHLQTDINRQTASACVIPLTVDLFEALLTCPKRFVLERYLSRSDSPTINEGDRMLMEDGAQFAQLCRQKYALSSSSMGGQSIYRITNPSFENALEETAKILEYYFGTYLPKQDIQMCEPMTMFMPALNALVDPAEFTRLASHSSVSDTMKELGDAAVGTDLKDQQVLFELRTRINVLQYFPSSNKWIAHASQASTELKPKDMDRLFRKQLFQLYTLRHCADTASRAYRPPRRNESGNPSFEPQRIGSTSFSSSFYDLRKTSPSFVASLNDVSISVGGAASTNGGAIGGTAMAHDDHSSSSSMAQSIRQKNAAAAGGGVTATVNTLHSRMVPIGEDCNSPRTMATMICSTPASVLRGHFLGGNLSVTSMREELAMLERMALAEEEGEVDEAGDGGAKPRKKRPASARALSGDVSPELASLLSHVPTPVAANLLPTLTTSAPAAVEAAETISDPFSKEIERLQRHHREQRVLLAPQIAHAEAIAATLSDREHLEFPFVLPIGSEFMSDMGLGDVLFSHCGRIIREIGIVGAHDDGNKTLEKVFATATRRESLTSAYNEVRRGGSRKQRPELTPDLAMACYRDACSDCQFFKAGYCRSDVPSTSTESHEFVLTLPGARTGVKKCLYRGNVRTAKDVLKKLPTLLPPPALAQGTSASPAISNSKSTALATTVEEEQELSAAVDQLNDKQKMYAYCSVHGLVAVNLAHIRRWLLSVRYPLIAIDFEAASFALPRFGKLKPYGHLPFQFSSLSYATDPFASEWAAAASFGCGGDHVSPPSQNILTADGAKSKKKTKSAEKEKAPKATVTTPSSYDPFPPTAYFASHLTKIPEPVVKMSYCYVGSDCDPREDPRRCVADALATMIVRSREAQKRFNAECAASSKSNPAASTHAFFIASALNGGVGGAKAKPQKLLTIAPPVSSSGRVGKDSKKTTEEPTKSSSTIAVDIASVRGSHNRYRATHLLTDGLHSTISKAANLALTVDDPAAHGTLLGHSVAFERMSFASVSLLVREGSTGYEPKPKAADLFDSLVFMDSLRLATDGIIHPMTMGSNSLKKLVPALVPTEGTQYSDLDISDGQTAAAVFRDWITTMTQKLPLQSVHDSAAVSNHTHSSSSALSTDLKDSSHPITRRDYEQHAQRVAAFKETFDKKRDELVAYCNTDTEQMVAVVREMSRIGRLAEMLMARGNGAERLLVTISSKNKRSTKNESVGEESTATFDSPCSLRTPSGETLPTFWVDFDNGWVGVPLKTVIGTREH